MKQVLFNLLLAFFISGGVANAATNTLHDKPLKTAPAGTDETYVWDTITSTLKKTTFAPFLVGDCTGFPCLDGTSDGGNYIKLWAGTGSYWTALQGGSPAANRSWRLPIAAPPSAGTTYLMNMDEYGQMGFIAPSTFLTPTGSGAALTIDASGFDGNLTTSDNTLQELLQKVDDLVVGGGGYTNLTEFVGQTAWRLFYSDGSGDVKELSLGSDGEYLKSNGAALAPTWATPSGAAHDAVTLGTDADAVLGLSAQQITLDSQTANTVFAAPNGSAGDPTFRALVAADIPTLNQSTTGNAATATALQTARTIGGVSFDGSANISLPGVNASGTQNTSGNAATATALASNPTDCTTGQYSTAIAANGNLTCGQVSYSQVSGTPTIPTALSGFTDDSTHRVVTDTQISTWNAKQNAIVAGTDYLAPTGIGASLTFTATGFNGNLATTTNTVQELADAVDNIPGDTDDQTAAEVSVADTAGHYTATNVETVLAEIGAYPLIAWGTGLTETVGSGTNTISVTPNTYQAYDADWLGITANGASLVSTNYAGMKTLLDTDDIQTLTGISAGTPHLGTFTGTTITDSSTIKAGMQSLETAVEGKQPADAQLDTWSGVSPGTGVATAIAVNADTVGGLPITIAKGAYTVDTASIAANTCATAVAITATGVATTDTIIASPNAILSSVAGFGVTTAGAVRVDVYPTSGNVNFQFCNPTGTAIDPGSVTFNWRVLR